MPAGENPPGTSGMLFVLLSVIPLAHPVPDIGHDAVVAQQAVGQQQLGIIGNPLEYKGHGAVPGLLWQIG